MCVMVNAWCGRSGTQDDEVVVFGLSTIGNGLLVGRWDSLGLSESCPGVVFVVVLVCWWGPRGEGVVDRVGRCPGG